MSYPRSPIFSNVVVDENNTSDTIIVVVVVVSTRDESMSEIPVGSVGSTAVVLWEWKRAWEWLGGNARE